MKRFEALKTYLLPMLILGVFMILPGCGGGGGGIFGGGEWDKPHTPTITAYSFVGFPAASGVINEPAKTIAVTLPFGTNVTNLVATYTTTGTAVKVGAVVQTNGTTANNFTAPVLYTVTAADGTTATYTVTITIAPNSAKAITADSFVGFSAFPGVINEPAKTIAVILPFGTNLTNLIATFTITGKNAAVSGVQQTSGSTPNNFSAPVLYTVTADDGSTATYTVTVVIAPNTAKAITAYSFVGFSAAPGVVNESAKTIAMTLPSGTDVRTLIATFATTGKSVAVGGVTQISGTTSNNFTAPVIYTVTAADGSSAAYTVTVTLAPSSAKAITAYSFVGFPSFQGVINEPAKTIAVTLPFGTNVTTLIAAFTTTGTIVKVGSTIQTSTATPNTFTAPVGYTVIAADGSSVAYTVTVTLAPSPAKAITAYSFVGFPAAPGVINESAKTIAVTLPFGTDPTALIATFTTTGTIVKVGTAIQTSTATLNNFTLPVIYTVTAADGSTAAYTVTVTIVSNPAKAITAYSFVGFPAFAGVINESAKTIAVNLPFGTDLTTLIAAFTTTGTIVKVGATVQTSTATLNNFTAPVVYTVTAADGSTAAYTVTVTLAPSPAKAITAYSFVGFPAAPGVINEAAKNITVTLPFGTDVTTLIAAFTTTGTIVKVGATVQTSTATLNNFTAPVVYTVTAADGSTAAYTVTVMLALNPAKAITAYSFVGFPAAPVVINEPAKSIAVTLPFGTDVTTLIAAFTTTGTIVKVGATVQTSTATLNNFTAPVVYTVTAADGTTVAYTVTVTLALNPAKAITSFFFVGFASSPGAINELAKTISVTLPPGTDVTTLIATFATTGTIVKIGAAVQTSTATINNFTLPVVYTVTAADSSTANYTVTVTLGLGPAPAALGTAAPYGGFGGGAGMTNQGLLSVITGDIGSTSASTLMTGFHDSTGDEYTQTPLNKGNVTGRIYTDAPPPVIFTTGPFGGTAATKAIADAAAADALIAYNYLAGLPGGAFAGAGELGGLTLPPGTYTSATTFKLTSGDLTLNGGPNDIWVFQVGSGLTIGAPGFPRSVTLTGGAQAKNVFWQVTSAARIEDRCNMVGTIIATSGVTISTAGQLSTTTLNGRALSLVASVTMVNTLINVPAP